MDSAVLKMVGVAGIGGVALAVVLYVFRDIIGKPLYPLLTKEQAYKLLNRIVILVFIIGVLGIGASLTINVVNSWMTKPVGDNALPKQLRGYVRDDKEQPIAGARISLDEFPGIMTDTPSDGSFVLDIPDGRRQGVRVRVVKDGYHPNPCVRDLDLDQGDNLVILTTFEKQSRLQC
jgi:hypothetical protein